MPKKPLNLKGYNPFDKTGPYAELISNDCSTEILTHSFHALAKGEIEYIIIPWGKVYLRITRESKG